VLWERPQRTARGRPAGPPATAPPGCTGLPAGNADANGGRTPAVCNGRPRWLPPWRKARPPVAAADGATPRTRPCHIVGGRHQCRPGGVPGGRGHGARKALCARGGGGAVIETRPRAMRRTQLTQYRAACLQPFSQKSHTPTVPKEFQIGLHDTAEADLEHFWNCCSAGFLGERLHCEMEYYLREHQQDYHFEIYKRLPPGFTVKQFRRRWRRPPWDCLERVPKTVSKRTVESFGEQFRG